MMRGISLFAIAAIAAIPFATAGTARADSPFWSQGYVSKTVIYTSDNGSRKIKKCRRLKQGGGDSRRCYNRKKVAHYYGNGGSAAYGGSTVYSVGSNAVGGSLIGAALGALTGSQFGKGKGRAATVIGGAVIGALIGGNIGQSMDQTDQAYVTQTLETQPSGTPIEWHNDETGGDYTVTPVRTYQTPSGTYCREYTTWGWIGDYEEKLHGTACRMPDGSWQRVN